MGLIGRWGWRGRRRGRGSDLLYLPTVPYKLCLLAGLAVVESVVVEYWWEYVITILCLENICGILM